MRHLAYCPDENKWVENPGCEGEIPQVITDGSFTVVTTEIGRGTLVLDLYGTDDSKIDHFQQLFEPYIVDGRVKPTPATAIRLAHEVLGDTG